MKDKPENSKSPSNPKADSEKAEKLRKKGNDLYLKKDYNGFLVLTFHEALEHRASFL